jgi:hypothetical protein
MASVLDALECERAVVLGLEGAFPAMLFSASYLDRTQALALYNPVARLLRGPRITADLR